MRRRGLLAALAVAGAGVALLVSSGAGAAEERPRGTIVFASEAEGMFRIAAHGGAPRRILRPFAAHHPSWAPHGRSLAWAAGTAGIWRSGADGSRPRRLTRPAPVLGETPYDHAPDWSPDGRWILFTRSTPTEADDEGNVVAYSSSLWRVPAAGGAARRVGAAIDVEHATWSPGGRRIAFNDRRGRLWSARADGSGRRSLGARLRGARPLWSPDGRQIAFVDMSTGRHRGRLTVLDLRSGSVRRLAHLNLAREGTGNSPSRSFAWSPDGSRLAAARLRPTRCAPACLRFELVVVRVRDARVDVVHHFPTSGDLVWGLDWR